LGRQVMKTPEIRLSLILCTSDGYPSGPGLREFV
jgi:hypothetical protein